MNALDLFQAIGCLEEQRLARSEQGFPSQDKKEGPIMKNDLNKSENSAKKPRLTAGRVIRNILAAALILSMLTVTAYAVGGYVIFDSPQEMLDKLFGDNTGYDHKDVTQWTDPEKPGAVYDSPGFDRAPVDEEAAGEAAALVSPVGQSISADGYTLRIDANLYDQVTRCGVLTYTLENPDGLPEYTVSENGSVSIDSMRVFDTIIYGYDHIIADQSSDTKLTAAFYYRLMEGGPSEITIGFNGWVLPHRQDYAQTLEALTERMRQEKAQEAEEYVDFEIENLRESCGGHEAEFQRIMEANPREKRLEEYYVYLAEQEYARLYPLSEQTITIPEAALGELSHVSVDQGITISPIAIHVEDVTLLGVEEGASFDSIKLRFQDGSEYIVRDDATSSYIFWVGSGEKNDSTLMFNRIIDVTQLTTVVLDNVEYPVA